MSYIGKILTAPKGGTGVANSSTLTLGGDTSFIGASTFAATLAGNTAITFPTTGILATTASIPSLPISVTNGGTGLTGTTANQILYSSATNTISGIPTANFGVMVTDGSGIPSILSILPSQVQANITTLGNVGSNLMGLTLINIDGKVTGATKIATTDSGMRFVPLFINIEVTAASGVISVSSLSIGTNAASYNNILSITALTGATAQNMTVQLSANALVLSVAPSTDIFINITTGAVGTTYTLRTSVLGFYY